ncbi:MAG: ABC transporter ATP-binding protein [Planctomycetota bacterium]
MTGQKTPQTAGTAARPDVVVKTVNLSKVYTDFWGYTKVLALNQLNLEVYKGEIFGLLGPNGSGKTTTTKLLLGLLFPTDGSATVMGYPPGTVEANKRIGFLPEESYLYRFLNAEETLDFYGQLFRWEFQGVKIPRRERAKRVDALIKQVGLDFARKRALREYSKGMSRRIGLAQALINDPEFIILDEPTTGLDPIGCREMKDLIRRLRDEGRTIFLCSHLLADVEEICDRIAILHQGELRVMGKLTDLLQRQDEVILRMRNVSDQALTQIRGQVSASGELLSVEHPTNTLEDLFLNVVRESS